MEPIPPSSASVDDFERRPGEDIMDFLARDRKRLDEKSDKTMAEFRAVCHATKEKFKEVVFHCNRASKAWDETAARIQAIRSQDSRDLPST